MPDVTLNEIVEFVAAERPCRKEEISLETTLARDLGLDGDEAEEFMQALGKRFAVDMSSIQWSRHFGPEIPFIPLVLLWPPWWRWQKRMIGISVADFFESARAGRWTITYEKSEQVQA